MFASAGSAFVGRAGGDDLAERRIHRPGVAVRRLRAPEDVRVIEEIEALEPEQHRPASELDAVLR